MFEADRTIDSKRSFRFFWLTLYIAINAIATIIIVSKKELIGDVTEPINDTSVVYVAFVLVGFFYWLLLGPLFSLAAKIKVKPLNVNNHEAIGEQIGLLIFAWQICFLIFNSVYGTSVAGAGNLSSGSVLGYVFVLLDSDMLFFIYYGIYRDSRYFKHNLLLYILSNVMRGWNGIFLFIMFFESCRMYRERRLKVRIVLALLLGTVVMYPVLSAVKWAIRANAFVGDSSFSVASDTVGSLDYDDYANLIAIGVEHIVQRLQSVSALVDIIKNQSELSAEFQSGKYLPFWLDGLHGIVFDRLSNGNLFAHTERVSVGVAYWEKLRTNMNFDGVGNVAISYPGWIVIAPYYVIPYLLYSLGIGLFQLLIIKKITRHVAAQEMVWLAWLVYLMAPWFGAMVKFAYSVFFFYLAYVYLSKRGTRLSNLER